MIVMSGAIAARSASVLGPVDNPPCSLRLLLCGKGNFPQGFPERVLAPQSELVKAASSIEIFGEAKRAGNSYYILTHIVRGERLYESNIYDQ